MIRNKNSRIIALTLLIATAFMASCGAQGEGQSESLPTHRNIGMVSSAHPIATEAGLEILKKAGVLSMRPLLSHPP